MLLFSRSRVFASPTWTSFLSIVIIIGLMITTRSSSASPGPTIIKNTPAFIPRRVNNFVTRHGVWLNFRDLSSQTVGGQENYRFGSHMTYVIKAIVNNIYQDMPGKLMEWGECRYTYDGRQYGCNELRFDYLKNEPVFTWVERQNVDICNGTIIGGHGNQHEELYICKFEFYDFYQNTYQTLLGHLIPRLGKCFSSWYSVERSSNEYKVLADSSYL
ncbi:unnamed protein product [Allacma fusca]|uniref:Uncharacterized protein n=1 Tax=Allacma fusca TaxID=39272 RepID=A0A8J2KA28_9HEXA|nr:unnamed protein product [Allacma fusca]